MKLMVMLAVNNSVLCRLGIHRLSFGCGDDGSVDRQIQAAKDLEQYIDAVEGGPGMGFYRIVYSSAEARQAIQAGQLAVVLGTEVDTEWGCNTTNPGCTDALVVQQVQRYHDLGIRVVYPVHIVDNAFGGSALYTPIFELNNLLVNGTFFDITTTCDPLIEWRSSLRDKVSEIKKGVGEAVAGLVAAGILGPIALAIAVPILIPVLTTAVAGLTTAVPAIPRFAPILGVVVPAAPAMLGPLLPIAAVAIIAFVAFVPGAVGGPGTPNCNNRGFEHPPLPTVGTTLVNALMDQRMIIDVDHTDGRTFDGILTIAELRHYPGIVSGHTGLVGAGLTAFEAIPILAARGEVYNPAESARHEGNKTDAMVKRIVDVGGVVSLILHQGGRARIRDYDAADDVAFDCGDSSQAWAQVYLYATDPNGPLKLSAVSVGSDLNGLAGMPAPRFGLKACGNRPDHFGDFGPQYNPA